MKSWNLLKILGTPKKTNYSHREYILSLNENEVEGITVVSYKLHSDVYKRLRKFSTYQYDTLYLMRNKRAFNTMFFNLNQDVIVTDKDGTIIDLFKDQAPGFVSKKYPNGNKIYFGAVGIINNLDFKIKDRLTLNWRFLKEKR